MVPDKGGFYQYLSDGSIGGISMKHLLKNI